MGGAARPPAAPGGRGNLPTYLCARARLQYDGQRDYRHLGADHKGDTLHLHHGLDDRPHRCHAQLLPATSGILTRRLLFSTVFIALLGTIFYVNLYCSHSAAILLFYTAAILNYFLLHLVFIRLVVFRIYTGNYFMDGPHRSHAQLFPASSGIIRLVVFMIYIGWTTLWIDRIAAMLNYFLLHLVFIRLVVFRIIYWELLSLDRPHRFHAQLLPAAAPIHTPR